MYQMVSLLRCGDGSTASGVLRKHRVRDLVLEVESLYHPQTSPANTGGDRGGSNTPSPRPNANCSDGGSDNGTTSSPKRSTSTAASTNTEAAAGRAAVAGGGRGGGKPPLNGGGSAKGHDGAYVDGKEILRDGNEVVPAAGGSVNRDNSSSVYGGGVEADGPSNVSEGDRRSAASALTVEARRVDASAPPPPLATPDGSGKKGFLTVGRGRVGGMGAFGGALSPPSVSMMASPFRRAVNRFNGAMSSAENTIVRKASAFTEPTIASRENSRSGAVEIIDVASDGKHVSSGDAAAMDSAAGGLFDEGGRSMLENSGSSEGATPGVDSSGGTADIGLKLRAVGGGASGVLQTPGME